MKHKGDLIMYSIYKVINCLIKKLICKRLCYNLSVSQFLEHICVATQRKGSKSETWNGSKTRLYQIVHNTENMFLIVSLAITRSKMGLEIYFF